MCKGMYEHPCCNDDCEFVEFHAASFLFFLYLFLYLMVMVGAFLYSWYSSCEIRFILPYDLNYTLFEIVFARIYIGMLGSIW